MKDGAIFRTTSDTETIVQLIAKSKRDKMVDKLIDTLFQIQGGYSLVIMTNKKMIGSQRPFWNKAPCYRQIKRFIYFCIRNMRIRYCWCKIFTRS